MTTPTARRFIAGFRGCLSAGLAGLIGLLPGSPDAYTQARENMVTGTIEARGVTDSLTLAAMRAVLRHEFVPAGLRSQAYADRPLPIGHGQTISQPYIVAAMTELLQVEPGSTVLEIGTGSGYQAAVLAEFVDMVYSIEIVPELAESGSATLERMGYHNVMVTSGDGYYGWEEYAPFDGIVVTAAATHIPPPLVEQLSPGARMVIPVGPPMQVQTLMVVEKRHDGTVFMRSVMPVTFVPLTGSG
jgi:protein-L-isoaspartate(D-aspartate) O-methyltransferase